MIQLWKETLLPGTQINARTMRPFTITTEDVLAGRRNINRMVKKGRNIPLVWEHQNVEENSEDDWKANYARNTFGRVGGARISTFEDVQSGLAKMAGTLLVRHDVFRSEDAEQVKRTGFVSPKIYRGYEDSQGENYDGLTVAHIASTPTACQFWQTPFQLSDDDAMYLSYTLPETDDDEDFELPDTEDACPTYLEAFTDWLDGFALSATETEEGVTVAEEKPPKKEPDGDEGGGGGGMGAEIKAIIKALVPHGITLSDKISSLKELLIGIESAGAGAAPMDETPAEEPPAEPENPDESGGTTAGGGPPMMMSTLDKNPARKKLALTEAAKERKLMVDRVEAAFKTGRISRPERRAMLRTPADTSIAMSFTALGDIAGKGWPEYLTKLDEIEKRPAHSVLNPTGETAKGGLNLSTVDKPDNAVRKEMTPERLAVMEKIITGELDVRKA